MGRRITVYLEEDVLEQLNQHTQVSPLSRSEIIGVAVRRFLRDERRRARADRPGADVARRIASGELPSSRVDAQRLRAEGVPWEN